MRLHRSTEPAGAPTIPDPAEILLLRTCEDGSLTAIVQGLRTRFPKARIVLLSSARQSIARCDLDHHHVHTGGKRALIKWLHSRRWSIVVVPFGDNLLWRWRLTLPWVASADRRIVVWPDGASGELDIEVWAREVWRGAQNRWFLALQLAASLVRDVLVGVLAVTGMLLRLPVHIGGALLRRPGAGIASRSR